MKVGVTGCVHGELEEIYNSLSAMEKQENCNVDLLLCCGDFHATRNEDDVKSLANPEKYPEVNSFYKFYSGEKIAPVLTIFIGGNNEASNYLQELPFGGWAAPNIYYMGYAGCINVGGIRIAGLSGIYKKYNHFKGHHEFPPYTEDTKRSVYHVRELEVFRLKQLSERIDICMSHDWPQNIDKFGDYKGLVEIKPNLQNDIERSCLGSPPSKELLEKLQPSFWLAAHLHVHFTALVSHKDTNRQTNFLALDKCLGEEEERKFLKIIDVDNDEEQEEEQKDLKLSYDLEWLTVLYLTQHLNSAKKYNCSMPKPNNNGVKWNFTPTEEEKELILSKFDNDLIIPMNFCRTVKPYDPMFKNAHPRQQKLQRNPQTLTFCNKLDIQDPVLAAIGPSSF